MGRLKSLTILLTLGAWATATEGAPPDDAPPASSSPAPAARKNPPAPPSDYVKAAVKLARSGDPRAVEYARAADQYRDMLSAADQAKLDEVLGKLAGPAKTDPAVTPASAPADAPPAIGGASTSPADVAVRQKAEGLIARARQALANGQVEQARRYAQEADAMHAPFGASEDHPGRVLADIDRMATGGLRSRGATPDAKQEARWLLQSAREQIALGHYDDAAAKIAKARGMDVKWSLFDDTPKKVEEILEKARPKVAASGIKGDRRQAKAKLKEARDLIATGQPEAAEAIATEVASWNLRYSVMEDTPTKVAQAARAQRRRDTARAAGPKGQPSEAIYHSLVAASRQLMQAGRIDEAEAKARQALAMRVTPPVTSDRAEAVLHDIAMTRAAAPAPTPTVAAAPAPVDTQVTPVAVQMPAAAPVAAPAPAPIAEPGSLAAEREANDLLARGERAAAANKFVEAQNLKAQEDAASAPPAVAPADAPAQAPAAPAGDPGPDLSAPPSLSGTPAPVPAGPGVGALDQAKALLANGNYPAARQAAAQAKEQGAAVEADALLAQIGQIEQGAALKIYESALASIRKGTADDMGHARALLNELQAMELDESTKQKVEDLLMKVPGEGAGRAQVGIPSIEDKETVAAQKLNAEIGTKMAEARRLMETDPDKAIALLTATVEQIKGAGLKDAVARTMVLRVQANIELAKKDKVAFDQKMKDKTFRAEIENKRLRILEADKAKKERMASLMGKAESAMADGKFDEAEKLYGLAADIDPNEVAALAGRTLARTRRHYERDKSIRRDKDETFLNAMQDVDSVGIVSAKAMRDGIDPGAGFAELTQRRRAMAERLAPRKNIQILETQKILSKPVTINLEKTTLDEAIKYLGELTGLNILLDRKALAEEAITQATPVQIQATNLKLSSIITYMLNDLSLTYMIDDEGVLVITSPQASQKRTVTQVYNVADLVVPVNQRQKFSPGAPGTINFPGMAQPNNPNDMAAQAAAMNGQPGVFQAPQGQDDIAVKNGEREDRNLDFGPLIGLIKTAVAPGTWRDDHSAADSMGGYGQGAGMAGAGGGAGDGGPIGTITPFYLNISLIIRHTAEVHDDIVDLLRQLRRLQDLQVSIEVRFITVSDSFFEQIGVDFDFSIQSDAVGRKSSFAIPNPAALPGANTTTTGGTTTTGTTNGVNPYLINPIRDHAFGAKQPLIVGHTGANPQGNGNPGDFTSDLQLPFTQGSAGVIAPFNALTGNTAATFGIAFLSDLEVYLFLTAVQGDTRSNLVQAPKVTSFNGANATVSNFTARNYVQFLQPIVGAGAVAFSPSIGTIPDGVILNVTPVVSADRRYVRMTLAPNFTTFIQFDTFQIPAAVGGGGIGGQASAINAQVQLPVFSFTNVATTVTVPDGGTVLLGGVKRLREERREFGVPILSKTPLINRLFRNIGIGRTTDSLMLMVTPRIIILEEEEEKLGIPAVQNVTF